MIKNERQYRITKVQAQKFERALATVQEKPDRDIHPVFQKVERTALLSQWEDLQTQLREYEELQSGKAKIPAEIESLEDLPKILIKARIASGLTQKDLAECLGIKEQQIQRYEATDYRMASFARLLEIADALGIRRRKDVSMPKAKVSLENLFRRLKKAGLEYEFITNRLIPRHLLATLESNSYDEKEKTESFCLQMAEILGSVFGWTTDSILGPSALKMDAAKTGGVNFKVPSRAESRRLDAYVLYAHYLALLVLETTKGIPKSRIPVDPDELRQEVETGFGSVTFENVLRYVWGLGIPVLPLTDPGAFHGACWRVEWRNIIVLKQRTHSLARWLFDLLHELRHTAQDPGKKELSLIEASPTSKERRESPDEETASQFAGDVILCGRAEELAQICVEEAKGRLEWLKRAVPRVADQENVAVDALANYMAFRLSLQGENWWGAAENLQATDSRPSEIARNILLEHTRLDELNELDRDLLMLTLSGEEA